ncbi:MAG: hypothetical protein O7H39_04280 [Gammaproteobacteria bacterium]|nr:hypothetical protein [Gammaproteobacteria bacterium]
MNITKQLLVALALVWLQGAFAAQQVQESALTCADFRPTDAALERYPELVGACEGIVERNGELFGKFKAVIRRPGNRDIRIYIPAVDRVMTVTPKRDARVQVGNRSIRPRDLDRGQEFSMYLAVAQFAEPDIDEIAFVTEENLIIEHTVTAAPMLPATASPWPAVGLVGGLAVLGAALMRRQRRLQRRIV